jgi:hypothetical protein
MVAGGLSLGFRSNLNATPLTRLFDLPTKYQQPAVAKTKYGNVPTVFDGVKYDSKREAEFAQELKLLMHVQGPGRVESWDRQIRFPLIVNDVTVGHLVVDFLVRYADGRKELVEIKSTATQTPLFKFKLKVFAATWLRDHPDIDYRIQT